MVSFLAAHQVTTPTAGVGFLVGLASPPLADRGDEHGRLEADSEFVEAVGDGPEALDGP